MILYALYGAALYGAAIIIYIYMSVSRLGMQLDCAIRLRTAH